MVALRSCSMTGTSKLIICMRTSTTSACVSRTTVKWQYEIVTWWKAIGFPIESLDIRPENQHHFDSKFVQMWLKIRDTVQSPSSPRWFDVSAKSLSSRIHLCAEVPERRIRSVHCGGCRRERVFGRVLVLRDGSLATCTFGRR